MKLVQRKESRSINVNKNVSMNINAVLTFLSVYNREREKKAYEIIYEYTKISNQ